MRWQEAAFDDALTSLRQLGIPDVLPALRAVGLGISRTVLGGSHSVAIYPPVDSLTPFDPIQAVGAMGWGKEISLYVHIPFCETRCTFCHYTVEHYDGGTENRAGNGKVAHYLATLTRELAFWGARLARSGTGVSSVYIGGGTPLVLDGVALGELIHTIRDQYDVLSGAEVCIEGSPLTITAPDGTDKLRLLKDLGVTRLSFGVQSFDDTVLKYAARGYTRDTPMHACVIANDVFENWNLDLIQGLYKGSPSETWNNLTYIAEMRPPHLTWYHGRFADRPQGHWYKTKSKHPDFEDEQATLLGRMLLWNQLAALGYHQIDGNRFVRAHRYIDPFKKIRTSISSHLLGVGPASYSHAGANAPSRRFYGYVVRNEPAIRAYIETVSAGKAPIATGRIIDQEEFLAASYATGLRNGRIENDDLRLLRFELPELSRHYDSLANELIDLGALETYQCEDGKAGLRLSKLGRLFEDETLALFFSPAVNRTLKRNSSYERERFDDTLDTVEVLS
jgi:coproporphyrinogen III oxidase-like Fe-S oxidoreductase